MTNIKKEIEKTKAELWNALVRTALSHEQKQLKNRHIDVYASLIKKHGLLNSDKPFEFPDSRTKQIFMAEFNQLGHDHVYSRLCRCRNTDVVG